MEYDKLSLIVLDPKLEESLDKLLLREHICVKSNFLNYSHYIITSSKLQFIPKFKTLEETIVGVKNHNCMYKGVCSIYDGKVLMVIQIEKSFGPQICDYSGFTNSDMIKLFSLSTLVATKLEEIKGKNKLHAHRNMLQVFLQSMGQMIVEKFYPSLMRKIQKILPGNLGYSNAFALLYNKDGMCDYKLKLSLCSITLLSRIALNH
jgi:hypothetical protein